MRPGVTASSALAAASTSAFSAIADCVRSMSRRRSTRSASTPPPSEKMTIGTMRASPSKPIAGADPVSS
jgi:hypothetical protein